MTDNPDIRFSPDGPDDKMRVYKYPDAGYWEYDLSSEWDEFTPKPPAPPNRSWIRRTLDDLKRHYCNTPV